ncbi:MAG: hypothetical protein ACLP1X_24875 [Polyangiaceae bacterium]
MTRMASGKISFRWRQKRTRAMKMEAAIFPIVTARGVKVTSIQ